MQLSPGSAPRRCAGEDAHGCADAGRPSLTIQVQRYVLVRLSCALAWFLSSLFCARFGSLGLLSHYTVLGHVLVRCWGYRPTVAPQELPSVGYGFDNRVYLDEVTIHASSGAQTNHVCRQRLSVLEIDMESQD